MVLEHTIFGEHHVISFILCIWIFDVKTFLKYKRTNTFMPFLWRHKVLSLLVFFKHQRVLASYLHSEEFTLKQKISIRKDLTQYAPHWRCIHWRIHEFRSFELSVKNIFIVSVLAQSTYSESRGSSPLHMQITTRQSNIPYYHT